MLIITWEAVEITCAFLMTQSTTNIPIAGRQRAPSMELSMKWVPLICLQITCITMTRRVPCASSDHVVRNWWCPQGMTVHPAGLKSIMGIWWQLITATRARETLSALIGRLSMSQAPNLIKMVHCCIFYPWLLYINKVSSSFWGLNTADRNQPRKPRDSTLYSIP